MKAHPYLSGNLAPVRTEHNLTYLTGLKSYGTFLMVGIQYMTYTLEEIIIGIH